MMSGNKSRSNIICILSFVFGSLVAIIHRDNVVTASNNTNDVSLDTLVMDRTSISDEGVVINEVMFFPSEGQFEWVELKNIGTDSIDISGWSITDEDDNWFEIPDELPPVPAGAFVVIIFDGAGLSLDDYDFGDNSAILHSQAGLVDILEDNFDQLSLYRDLQIVYLPIILAGEVEQSKDNGLQIETDGIQNSKRIASFVAWGADPAEDGRDAVEAGIWFSMDFIHYSSIDNETNAPMYTNESIGLYPIFSNLYSTNWTIFLDESNSQGSDNPVPGIKARDPYGDSELDSNTFAVYWEFVDNAIGYKFQLDDNVDFSSRLYDLELESPAFYASESVPEGLYYWRVKVLFPESKESAWSSAFEVYSSESGLVSQTEMLNIQWQLQRKDTNMLCLFGDNEFGDVRWDAEHLPARGIQEHGKNYCSRATISMIASYYGAELSQDRIAFEDFKNKQIVYGDKYICEYDTCNELGHGLWNDFYISTLFENVGITGVTTIGGAQSFEDIVNWIDGLRPLGLRLEWAGRYTYGHFLVLDGYMVEEKDGQTIQKVHLLDPYVGEIWVRYDGVKPYITTTYVTPNYTPIDILVDDENGNGTPDTIEDSDGDWICDFDENHRFDTNPNVADTDADGVTDKLDLREYVFDRYGNWLLRRADWDWDGLRKELDPDNDEGGSWDGFEDFNLNGKYEPELGESSNFNKSDEQPYSYTRVFFDDFSSYPNTNDRWEIIRLHPEDTINEASWDSENQTLYLTRTSARKGVAIFANYELTSKKWEVFFRYKVGGGDADGFVFNFYKDKLSYGLPGCGGSLGFEICESQTNCKLTNEIQGYGIEFDNWENEPSENIDDPSSNHVALIKDSVGNHIIYSNDGRTEDNMWHTVVISFNFGNISVIIDSEDILSYQISEPDYTFSGVGFTAGTGANTNNHVVDDFSLFVYD